MSYSSPHTCQRLSPSYLSSSCCWVERTSSSRHPSFKSISDGSPEHPGMRTVPVWVRTPRACSNRHRSTTPICPFTGLREQFEDYASQHLLQVMLADCPCHTGSSWVTQLPRTRLGSAVTHKKQEKWTLSLSLWGAWLLRQECQFIHTTDIKGQISAAMCPLRTRLHSKKWVTGTLWYCANITKCL